MTCSRVPDYFFQTCGPISANASFHDFDTYDDYLKTDACTAQQCTPCTRITDQGFNTKERIPIPKPPRTSDFDPPIQPPAMDCCLHRANKTSRKFICNFGPSSASCISQCLEMERTRCASFWKLIDQRPELQSLMRTGEFEHINLPQIVEPRKPKDTSITCVNAEELRAKNKALHDEERERTNKRRQILEELQKKSGQPGRSRGKPKVKSGNKCAPVLDPITDFSQLVLEMNAFDKMVGNPVRTCMNPLSAASLEQVDPRRVSGGKKELSNSSFEGEWGEGEEEMLSDPGRENETQEFGAEQNQEKLETGESGESFGVKKVSRP